MWIEITLSLFVIMKSSVILRVRMWIEIILLSSVLIDMNVILRVRMWIEIWYERRYTIDDSSHPPCEDVD